jgi:predicted site-specific integrase-resolvase
MLLAPSICNDRHEAMSYSLVEAATACGVNRSTVLRAIRAGKISAGKDEQGEWRIEAVEPPPRLSTRADARGTLRAGASRRTDR